MTTKGSGASPGKGPADKQINGQQSRRKRIARNGVGVFTVVVCAMTLAGFLGRLGWPFEIASHFRVQYAWLLLASMIGVVAIGHFRSALIPAVCFVANVSVVLPVYFASPIAVAGGRSLRAMSINVHSDNAEHARVIKLIRETDADVVLLQEVNPDWAKSLAPLKAGYPVVRIVARRGSYGVALLSRLPIDKVLFRAIGRVDDNTVVAAIDIDGQRLTVIGVHSVYPKTPARLKIRNQQFKRLAQLARSANGHVLLLGDLNCSPWSPYFGDLLRDATLCDSRNGFGNLPTWPASCRSGGIPIDHCLASSHIHVSKRTIGEDIGSDHLPVIVDFSLTPIAGSDSRN